ncbi:class I SAM-dependent methyltransferase [Aspergillus stella-maris]|uniref:class I SAM-dependent methyltransferase n=1 Tax=Aspergillus stella-maris TaxID=1810926 RepID=UPI003CCD2EEB
MTIKPRYNYYSPFFLWFYDFFVQILSNRLWWRCSTKFILLPFFIANTSARHMEIGVGTGYYLRAKVDDEQRRTPVTARTTNWPEKLTLVDSSIHCLRKAASRIAHDISTEPECVMADILEPLSLQRDEKFDSIALMYVLHCLPVPMATKGRVFENLRGLLADDGVLFGCTILGKGVRHNLLGRVLIWLYNYTGVFDNLGDGKEEILKLIRGNFEEVESEVVGAVLIFRAMRPRRG